MSNIEEGNKLIAEFMGGKIEMLEQPWENTPDVEAFYDVEKIPDLISPLTPKRLRYHKSWDWLMPVVKKVLYSGAHKSRKESDLWLAYYHVEAMLPVIKKDVIWEAVVKFIKVYNDENRSE